jgi:Fe-S oxidoreductase
LLPASATGQQMTSYVSILQPPLPALPFVAPGKTKKPREFHMVLIDNGRSAMRDDPVLHEALYCIRCSACLNVCANFETVGGHAFGGETYSGGIGGPWEAGTGKLMNARFSDLCTGCSRCVPQCPVRIDIPWLNQNLRQRMNQQQENSAVKSLFGSLTGSAPQDKIAPLQKQFFANYHTFGKWGTTFSSAANESARLPIARKIMENIFGVDQQRDLPAFPSKTWEQLFGEEQQHGVKAITIEPGIAMLADTFTNFGSPARGMAAIRILREVGADVVLTPSIPDGRAAISQGMIETARLQARAMANMLRPYLDSGRKIAVLEPSVLAMLRFDYRHLLDDQASFAALAENSIEAVQAVWEIATETGLEVAKLFPAARSRFGTKLFYHSHCQQRTCNAASQTIELLRAAGFDVVTSSVECCGMAGSFGYKHDYYELSMAVAEDLFAQVRRAEELDGPRTLVASGISCHEQLEAGMRRIVVHPAEVLFSTIAK